MAAQYPEELTCDMAETYHALDWRALGLPLAATLAAGLRENSRTRMALAGSVSTVDTLLLGAAVDALHLLVWAKTKDGQKGRSRPEPVVNRLLGVPSPRQATGFSCAADYEAARARILGEGWRQAAGGLPSSAAAAAPSPEGEGLGGRLKGER